jgi:predicted amidohydrolase
MQDVWQFCLQEDWAGALVCLASHATDTQLLTWERAHNKAEHAAQVRRVSRLLQGQGEPTEDMLQQPLALLCALDQLVAASSVRRFCGTPFVLANGSWWLLPLETPIREGAAMRKQLPRLDHYLKHHLVVAVQVGTAQEQVRVQVCVPTGNLAQKLRETARGAAALQAWIAHFDDGCCVTWKASPDNGRVTATGLDNEPKRLATATASLARAAQSRAHLFLAPELSLTPHQQAEVVALWVDQHQPEQASMLMLGSFHRSADGHTRNVAELTDGHTGLPLFVHHKLRVFGSYAAAGQAEMAEDITPGNTVSLLVTPLGIFTVLICKDFVDAHPLVHGLLQQLGADWVLVPSYGDDGNQTAQLRRADEISRKEVGCHVLVASQRNLGHSQGAALPGFWQPSGSRDPQHVGSDGGCVSVLLREPNVIPLDRRIAATNKPS